MFSVIYLVLLLIILTFVPHAWVQWQLRRFNREDCLQGSGLQLVEHLIQRFNLEEVRVEMSPAGDHYDPVRKTVVLNERWGHRATLTSVAIAAHEFSHAMQHHLGESGFILHSRVAQWTQWIGHCSQILSLGILSMTWLPGMFHALLAVVMVTAVVTLVLHLSVLPIEWDASFNKALPLLKSGGYLPEHHLRKARWILAAAALTYVAGAILSVLNLRLLMLWIRR